MDTNAYPVRFAIDNDTMVALSGTDTFYFLNSKENFNGGWTVTDKYMFNSYLRDGFIVGDPSIFNPLAVIPAADINRAMCVVMVYHLKTDDYRFFDTFRQDPIYGCAMEVSLTISKNGNIHIAVGLKLQGKSQPLVMIDGSDLKSLNKSQIPMKYPFSKDFGHRLLVADEYLLINTDISNFENYQILVYMYHPSIGWYYYNNFAIGSFVSDMLVNFGYLFILTKDTSGFYLFQYNLGIWDPIGKYPLVQPQPQYDYVTLSFDRTGTNFAFNIDGDVYLYHFVDEKFIFFDHFTGSCRNTYYGTKIHHFDPARDNYYYIVNCYGLTRYIKYNN
jgi:hypothetical protein